MLNIKKTLKASAVFLLASSLAVSSASAQKATSYNAENEIIVEGYSEREVRHFL